VLRRSLFSVCLFPAAIPEAFFCFVFDTAIFHRLTLAPEDNGPPLFLFQIGGSAPVSAFSAILLVPGFGVFLGGFGLGFGGPFAPPMSPCPKIHRHRFLRPSLSRRTAVFLHFREFDLRIPFEIVAVPIPPCIVLFVIRRTNPALGFPFSGSTSSPTPSLLLGKGSFPFGSAFSPISSCQILF